TPQELTTKSNRPIVCLCDYCKNEYETTPKRRLNGSKIIDKDSCINCRYKKREEVSLKRDGVKNSAQRKDVKEKIKESNLQKYGCEYGFQAESVKEKIKATCLEKYGVDHVMKNKD